MKVYGLYQTLVVDLPQEEFDKNGELSKKLNGLKGREAGAVFMLIWEYAKSNYEETSENFPTIEGDEIKLPYNGITTICKNGDSDVKFDVTNFPCDLRWILWKFSNVMEK